jgi:hypothetical protein
LLATGSEDIVRYLRGYDANELRCIGRAARERVLAGHTNDVRAREFERALEIAASSFLRARALSTT